MSMSRTVDRESRRLIREELLPTSSSKPERETQMLAERMAAGVAAGVYDVEHMAAVTFTRKAASELRGRFHLALERELSKATKDPDRTARVHAALSNLERFFAGTIHSFCARLLRERPVESGVSPGFTELDEVQDLELRQRVWRDFVTSARAVGDADMVALLEADVRPKDLDSAFATICVNDDVDFPPGEAESPDLKPAWKALERFWKELQSTCRPSSMGTRGVPFRSRRVSSAHSYVWPDIVSTALRSSPRFWTHGTAHHGSPCRGGRARWRKRGACVIGSRSCMSHFARPSSSRTSHNGISSGVSWMPNSISSSYGR